MDQKKNPIQLVHIYPPLASTERGRPSKVCGNGKHIIYSVSNIVVVRHLDDLNKCTIFDQHKFDVSAAMISASGNLCCSADVRGNVYIWEVNTEGHPVFKAFEDLLGGAVKDICWTGDGERIVVVGEGKTYFGKAFLVSSGSSVGEISGVSKVLLTCDMRQTRPFKLAVAGEEFSVCWFEGPPFKFKKSSKQHTNYVNTVRFNKSGDLFVSGSSDKRLFVYDGKTFDEIKEIQGDPHTRSITEVSWIDDATFITSSNDTTLKMWSLDGLIKTLKVEGALELEDMQVSVLATNNDAYSVSLGGTLNVYKDVKNLPDQSTCTQRHYGHNQVVGAMTIVGDILITGDNGGKILLWTNQVADKLQGVSHNKAVIGLSISANKDILYSLANEELKQTTLATRTIENTLQCEGQTIALAASAIKNDTCYILFSEGTIIEITNMVVGKVHKFGYECTAFDVNDKYFIIGDVKGAIHIVDIESGQEVTTLQLAQSKITCIRASGNRVLLGDTAGKMKLIDTDSKSEIFGDRWTYHTTIISSLSFSSNGKFAVSTSMDNKIMVWNLESGQRIYEKIDAHKRGILTGLVDGTNKIVTSGGDCTLKVWASLME